MVNMSNVRNRISILTEKSSPRRNINMVYEKCMKSQEPTSSDIKTCFNEWESLSENTNVSGAMLIKLFDHLCECKNITYITLDRLCNKICENSVPKFRNAAETQHLINVRLGRIKSKIQSKVNSNINTIKDATKDSIDNIKANTTNNIDKIKQNADALKQAAGIKDKEKEEEKKDKKIQEYFTMMNNACRDVIICDRIIENHLKISKRFNIDNIVKEMSNYSSSYEIINEFCKLIDTYNIPLSAKLSIALENGMYLLEKNHIDYDKNEDILNSVIDYNMMNTNEDNYQSVIDIMSNGISISDVFDNKSNLKSESYKYLVCNHSNMKAFDKNTQDAKMKFSEDGYYFSEAYNLLHSPINEDKKNNTLDIINKFKNNVKDKTVDSLKFLVRKIYTTDTDDIILEQDSLFNLIRIFFVIGSTLTINPILSVVAIITDSCISLHMKRKEIDKTITNYKNEIKKTKKKIENLKNKTTIDRTKQYLKKMEDGLRKLESYRDNLHTDEENMNRDSDDDEFNMDFNFDESTMIDMVSTIKLIEESVERIVDNKFSNSGEIVKFVRNNIESIDSNTIDNISSLLQNPNISDIFIRGSYINELQLFKNSLKTNKVKSISEKYSMMSCIDDNIRLINSVNESYNNEIKGTDIFREYNILSNYIDSIESIQEISTYTNIGNPINEMDFSNTLKLAAGKLKKSVQKLSDTDKTVSKNIDVSMNSFRQSVERSMTNDNREAVIRGSILPSASKTLKMALAAGATSVILNPVIAIIGVLGYIGTSKKYKAKERQIILDEIEVELQMVDRYLKIADDKDDLQAQKQLLITKRALERQQQRIKYKLRVDFGQDDVAKTNSNDNNDN